MNEKSFTYEDCERLNDKLSEFFKFISAYLCMRCSQPLGGAAPSDIDLTAGEHHHNGEINSCLTLKKSTDYNLFFNDIKHGFFHGLSTSFCSYIILGPSNFNKLNFASSLLHDFVKSAEGESTKNHDKKLKEYFPELLPETYFHANLTPQLTEAEGAVNWLVSSDRIELMRYKDYEQWADKRLSKALDCVPAQDKKIIKLFYKSVRPALENLFFGKDSIWLRHGIEPFNTLDHYLNNINGESIYPINDTLCPNAAKLARCGYPIEHDQFPFAYYSVRPRMKNIKNIDFQNVGHCSGHGIGATWGRLKGYIPLGRFKSEGGLIVDSKMRDHLYAQSNIKFKNWTFLYDNLDKEFEKKHGICVEGQKINNGEDLIKILEKLLNTDNIGVVKQINVFYLWLVAKLTRERLSLLGV